MCFSKSAQHHSKVKQRNSLLEIMENCFEMMVARCIKIGTVQTLTMLGLLPEVVTISQSGRLRKTPHIQNGFPRSLLFAG